MTSLQNKDIFYICHTYDSFQKDQIENISPYFHNVTTFTRSSTIIDVAGKIFPEKFGKYTSDKKINSISSPENCSQYLTQVSYVPIDFDYLRMGERHYRSVKKAIEKHNISPPDIIHSHFLWSAGYVGMRLKEEYDVPFIATGHGYDVYSLPFKSEAWRKRICKVLDSADHIITVSNSNLACLEKLGIDTPVSVIPNGYNASLFYPMDRMKCRENLGLPLDRKIILTVGNCVPVKGHKYLIEAMKEIHRKHSDVLCVIVGGGELYPSLQKMVSDLGLSDCIWMVGRKPHEEIPLWMNACDVFVLPSLNEGNPTVLVECLACGKPFIGSKVGGIPDMISDDKYGLLFEPGEVSDLTRNLNQALEIEWESMKIIEYASQFRWEDISKKIISIYHQYL